MSSERQKNTTGSGSEVGGVSAQEGLNVTSPSQQKYVTNSIKLYGLSHLFNRDVTSSPSGLKAKAKARDNAKEDIHQEQDDDDDDDDDDEDMPSDEEDDDEEEVGFFAYLSQKPCKMVIGSI